MIVVFDASTFVERNRLILSREVESEYREVIFRPEFDRFVSAERRRLILDTVIGAAERVEHVETVQECLDPKENKYQELGFAGGADVIVRSDARHLLSMHPWRGIRIQSRVDYIALARHGVRLKDSSCRKSPLWTDPIGRNRSR